MLFTREMTKGYVDEEDVSGNQHLAEAEREASRPVEVTQSWEPQQDLHLHAPGSRLVKEMQGGPVGPHPLAHSPSERVSLLK